MCRLSWILNIVLLALLGITLYQFVIRGSVAPSPDGRAAIVLTDAERNLVLSEMRGFLVAIQGISAAVVGGDVDGVVEHAKAVGMASSEGVPPALIGKLPLGFKKLGFATHRGFDQLALDIEQMGDAGLAQEKLATLMQNCVACHAAYRLTTE